MSTFAMTCIVLSMCLTVLNLVLDQRHRRKMKFEDEQHRKHMKELDDQHRRQMKEIGGPLSEVEANVLRGWAEDWKDVCRRAAKGRGEV